MTIQQAANTTIGKVKGIEYTYTNDGVTGDIINLVLIWFNRYNSEVAAFAPYLRGSSLTNTCYNIWAFVRNNIVYKKDPKGVQWVKSAAKLWADRQGDCKSYAVFVGSCLAQLGIEFIFRFVSYDKDNAVPTHVYVVVPYQGQEIIIDACFKTFDKQLPYQHKTDYPMTKVIGLAGLPKGTFTKPGFRPGHNPVQPVRPVNKPILLRQGGIPTLGGFDYYVGDGTPPATPTATGTSTAADAVNTVADISTGNWVAAAGHALSFITKLFAGHANWYKSDQSWQNGDWNAVAQSWIAFYSTPSYNSNGKNLFAGDLQGYFNGDVAKQFKGYAVKRYTQLPTVFNKTGNVQILQMYNSAVAQGLIPPDPTVNPAMAVITSGGTTTPGTGTGTTSPTGTLLTTYALTNGQSLGVTALAAGGLAYINGSVAPAATYTTTTGVSIAVGSNGLITSVTTGIATTQSASTGLLIPLALGAGLVFVFLKGGKKKK